MGLPFSCPLAAYVDIENGFESLTVKSIIFGDGEEKTPCRSISFKGEDTEPTIMRSTDSGKMRIEGSVSFRIRGNDFSNKAFSFEEKTSCLSSYDKCEEMYNECSRSYSDMENMRDLSLFDSMSPKDEAAVKLQKVYKSFRTRRKLADCAVLIEQSWWKLLDFAELKRSSISFFELDKQETAISRWSRARTRAAKVGKGLSKNSKAQKLALQHWLEAIDPRHRYGHNLHFYYDKWLHSQSREPFFYWLDIGEGKEVNLVEKCPRWKLHQQCIKYLGPMERKAYEVQMENGRLLYKQTGEFVDTTSEPKGAKWIFVLSTSRTLYVGIKKKGSFQHSSFLAGGATLAAGRIVAERGVLKAIWPHSGHYRPTKENFEDFISFLEENNVDIRDVKTDSVEDDKESLVKQGSSIHLSNHSSEEEMSEKERMETEEKADSVKDAAPLPMETPKLKLTTLEIPNRDDFLAILKSENGHEMAEEMQTFTPSEQYVSDDESEPALEDNIPDESILQRINSHKGLKSYQLGRQLSCKWTTGAGPRIGCLRDYPSELQSHALEQANLSPRSARVLRSNSNHRVNASPKSFFARINTRPYRPQSSPFSMEASETAFDELS